MRKILFGLMTLMCGVCMSAQAQQTIEYKLMRVHNVNDGTVTEIEVNNITHVEFLDVAYPAEMQYVDLDLPSHLLWATHNLGAENPWEVGNYYAWGETAPKETYSWSNYSTALAGGSKTTLRKYCTNEAYGEDGFTDGKSVLDLADDAAAQNCDNGSRMPTDKEYEELLRNCNWAWVSFKGVDGYRVSSKKDPSKYIFLPLTGYKHKTVSNKNTGYYWSSTTVGGDCFEAYSLSFTRNPPASGNAYNAHDRYCGRCVRPVRNAASE